MEFVVATLVAVCAIEATKVATTNVKCVTAMLKRELLQSFTEHFTEDHGEKAVSVVFSQSVHSLRQAVKQCLPLSPQHATPSPAVYHPPILSHDVA